MCSLISKFVAAFKYFTNQDAPGRHLRVYPDDTFIVSYPKSGNTWTRFLVANLVHPQEPVTLVMADCLIPLVDAQSRRYFKSMLRPRIIKSHYPFDPDYKRVIYVVRDPKDVAVSQYHYQIKRRVIEEGHPIERFVGRFIAGETCPYGSWGENVGSWLAARRNNPNFLLLRYEDMLKQTITELGRIASFLGIDPTPNRLAQAVERSSADHMRKLEKLEASKWNSTKDTRRDMFFVRTAKSGEWQASLPRPCVKRIETAWGPLMRALGYDIVWGENSGGTNPKAGSIL